MNEKHWFQALLNSKKGGDIKGTFPEETKAIPRGKHFTIGKTVTDPSIIGKALMDGVTVLGGTFMPSGIPAFNVFVIINGVLFSMVLLCNRDLHMMSLHALSDESYQTEIPARILDVSEFVFFDEDEFIDITKAHVPDSPNASQISEMLKGKRGVPNED